MTRRRGGRAAKRLVMPIALTFALMLTGDARAAVGDLSFAGCVGQPAGCAATSPGDALQYASGVALTADGRHLYVAAPSNAPGSVSHLTVGGDGAPTFAGCAGPEPGCVAGGPAIGGVTAVAVTPDGRNLYVGGGLGVSHFALDDGGAMTFKSCVGAIKGCVQPTPAQAVANAGGLAIAPDGRHLYVAKPEYQSTFPYAVNGGAVSHLTLADDGAPTFAGCVGELTGCTTTKPTAALRGARVVAAASGHLYVGAEKSLVHLTTTQSGSAAFAGCSGALAGCTPTTPAGALSGAGALALAADGRHLYAATDAIRHLTLGADGTPAPAGCVGAADGCAASTPADALDGAQGLALAPGHLYAAAGNAVTHLRVDGAGELSFAGCVGSTSGCTAITPPSALDNPIGVAVAPGVDHLYAASNAASALSHLRIETPPAPTPQPGPSPVPAPTPPPSSTAVAVASVATVSPTAGRPVLLSGAGSHGCAARGTRSTRASGGAGPGIVSYRWDFNGDAHIDADTGSVPQARFTFAQPGTHSVGLQVVDSNGCRSALTRLDVDVAVGARGCRTSLRRGRIDIAASCIRETSPGRFEVDLNTPASLNGLTVESTRPGQHLIVDAGGRSVRSLRADQPTRTSGIVISSEATVELSVDNAPNGKIKLGSKDLNRDPAEVDDADEDDEDAPGTRLFSFRVDRSCAPREGEVCAQLPGNFPLTGSIGLYLSDDRPVPGLILDANVELANPLRITGNLRLTGTVDEGIELDSFGFRAHTIDFGVGRVDEIGLTYTRLDEDSGDQDVWTGLARARLRTPMPIRVGGEMRFANGGFQRARFDLEGARVPVGPGIFLTGFGGQLGFNPFSIGGSLTGAIGPIDVGAGFRYREAWRGAPSSFRLDARVGILGFVRADGTLDIYGDGFVGAGLNVHAGFPSVDDPRILRVDGFVRGWTYNRRFQISGGVQIQVIGVFGGSVQGFVNNDYAAGCGEVRVGPVTPSGWARGRLRDGRIDWGFGGCDNIEPYCAAPPPGRSAPSCLGFASAQRSRSSAPQRVQVRGGVSATNLKVTSSTGVPQVKISGPSGTFTTPPDGRTTVQGDFIGSAVPEQHDLVVTILRPKAGVYTIEPLPGSPVVGRAMQASNLPDSRIRARVVRRGGRHRLVYAMRLVPGQRVQFVERGRDAGKVIGETRRARGAITFAPSTGGARKRTIVATPFLHGVPQRERTVGRYTAPAPQRPGRPGALRLRRSGNAVVATWGAARRATAYTVLVTAGDGRREALRVTARRLRVDRVFPGMSVRLTVRGTLGARETPGPARSGSLRRR